MEKLEFSLIKGNSEFVFKKDVYNNIVFFYETAMNMSFFNYFVRDFYIQNKIKNILCFNCGFNILKDNRDNNYFITVDTEKDIEVFRNKSYVYEIIKKSNTVFSIEYQYEDFICNLLDNLPAIKDKEYPIAIHLDKNNLSSKFKKSINNANKKGYFFIFHVEKDSLGYDCNLFHIKLYENEEKLNYKYKELDNFNVTYKEKEEPFHPVFFKNNMKLYEKVDYLYTVENLINF